MATSTGHAEAASKVTKVLRREGQRSTHQRREVFEAIVQADRQGLHPDIREIHQEIRGRGAHVSLASIYRTLTVLEALGLLRRHQLGERSVYEPTSRPAHGHIVNRATGAVADFRDEVIERQMCRRAEASGFELSRYTHILFVRYR